MPINYRWDPFSNVSTAVNITNEEHVIPSSSPFDIKLNEVPKHDSPSTLSIKVKDLLAAAITTSGATSITVTHGAWFAIENTITIDSEQMCVSGVASNTLTVTRGYNSTTATTHSLGAAVYIESSMAEVEATPTAGQFWADYSTGADGQSDWNTGTLRFNEADAGKTVVVSYIGTGTLMDIRVAFNTLDKLTTSGTFTAKYTGWHRITLVSGAGGGGGNGGIGASTSGAGGGGGGGGAGSTVVFYVYLTAGATYSYTIGAGGTAGANGASSDRGGKGGGGGYVTTITIDGTTYTTVAGSAGGDGREQLDTSGGYGGAGGAGAGGTGSPGSTGVSKPNNGGTPPGGKGGSGGGDGGGIANTAGADGYINVEYMAI